MHLGDLAGAAGARPAGGFVPLGELGSLRRGAAPTVPIYHKDLRPWTTSPPTRSGASARRSTACSAVDGALRTRSPTGRPSSGRYFGAPEDTGAGFKWDGEWQVTYVTFRDMGLAFARRWC